MKAVIFDFDGTLSEKGRNVWKAIWENCGYSTFRSSYYSELIKMFLNKEITHEEWCELTCKKFQERNFKLAGLREIAKNIVLVEGLNETLQNLKDNGYSLNIVSGGILSCIKYALKENVKYFDSINANKLIYDCQGNLLEIEGTEFDNEGKRDFVLKLMQETGMKIEDITFVGNGKNDEWVKQSGCTTICVNPYKTDVNDNSKWSFGIDKISSLPIILNALNKSKKQIKENIGHIDTRIGSFKKQRIGAEK